MTPDRRIILHGKVKTATAIIAAGLTIALVFVMFYLAVLLVAIQH